MKLVLTERIGNYSKSAEVDVEKEELKDILDTWFGEEIGKKLGVEGIECGFVAGTCSFKKDGMCTKMDGECLYM